VFDPPVGGEVCGLSQNVIVMALRIRPTMACEANTQAQRVKPWDKRWLA